MEKYLSKKIVVLSIFVLFVFLISFKLLDGGIISYTDTPYHFPDSTCNFFSTWSDNYLGVSYVAAMCGSPFIGYLPTILEKVGFSSSFSSYLTNFSPVLILCLIVYSVTRRISGSVLYGYFAGFFIILNNFILEHFLIWPSFYFVNIMSLVILFYLTYEIYNSGFDRKKIIYVIINSFLILHPAFFIMYFVYWGLFAIFYCVSKRKIKNIYKFVIVVFGVICIHSYWLFPFLHNLFIQNTQLVYSGNLLPVLSGHIKWTSYVLLFNFHNYPGPIRLHSGILQYVFYFGLLIIFIAPLFINKKYKNSNKKDYIFLIFLFVIFILFFNFSLGPKSRISGEEWMWAFTNIPGFTFFRSYTRFFIVSLIAMVFSFGFSLKMIKISNNKKNIIICMGIVFLIVSNLVFFSGNLNGALGTIKVPKEYYYINDNYFKNNKEIFSIISLPNTRYEQYKWSINSRSKDFHQMTYFDINFFSKPIAYGDLSTRLQDKQDLYKNIFNLSNEFDPITFNRSVAQLNVKYIIVKKDLVDNLNTTDRVIGIGYDKYYQFFKSDFQYILKEDNKYFTLFENKKYSPIFFGNSVNVKKIFPAKYVISISNLIKAENFGFAENYNPAWELYINKYTRNKSAMSATDLSYLWEKPIFDNTHKVVRGYANGWTIDPEYIKQNFSKEYYKKNPDGSIDVELILYFKPQSYFYLGLVVSGVTFLSCFGFLGYNWRQKRKKKLGEFTK